MALKVAILDDYQNVALAMGPWEQLDDQVEITTFTRLFAGENAAAEALRDSVPSSRCASGRPFHAP